MLKPYTKKYEDRSNMEQFEFVFYCDYCNNPIFTPVYKFEHQFANKKDLTESEKEARAIIYAHEHQLAIERANNEARLEFNNCEACGIMLCEDCSYYLNNGGIACKSCVEKEKNKKGGKGKK